jgi:DNA-binding response OmpR family regulator
MRILVVEDEEKLATLISRALQKSGHEVERVQTAPLRFLRFPAPSTISLSSIGTCR